MNPSYAELVNSCPDKEQIEKDFQTAFSNKDKLGMWLCVWKACHNLAKSIYAQRQVIVTEEKLLDVTTDAACYIMEFILGKNKKHPEGVHPEKLSSYCYLRVLKFIQDPKEVWYENNVIQMPQDNYKDIDMEIEDA